MVRNTHQTLKKNIVAPNHVARVDVIEFIGLVVGWGRLCHSRTSIVVVVVAVATSLLPCRRVLAVRENRMLFHPDPPCHQVC